MKIIRLLVFIGSFILIFFVRWQNLFSSPVPTPDLPSSNWKAVPFYYPNFYHPEACCGVGGQSFPAFWSLGGFFILLVAWIALNLIVFYLFKKFSNNTK